MGSIPNNMFTGVNGITRVSFENVPFACSCDSLWWLEYFEENGMIIDSETICQTPSSYVGQREQSYHAAVCDQGIKCDGGTLPALLTAVCLRPGDHRLHRRQRGHRAVDEDPEGG